MNRWWFAPAPATRLAAVRILVGVFATIDVIAIVPELHALARSGAPWDPVGPMRAFAVPPLGVEAIAIATALACAAFTVGYRYRVVAPLAALGLLLVTAYRSSWGMVFHTENLLVLHVIALAFAPAADAWAINTPRRPSAALRGPAEPDLAINTPRRPSAALRGPAEPDLAITPEARAGDAGYGWPLKLLAAITAATYVLAGVAKLRLAGLAWLDGDLLRDQVAIDNVRKALLGDRVAPLARILLEHPGGFVAFAVATLVVELGAPILVVGDALGRPGRALAKVWTLGAWSFHLGVVLAMNVWFPYPLSAVPFVVVFRPERGIAWIVRNVTRIGSVRQRGLSR